LIPGYLDSNGQLRMSIALVPDFSLLALFATFFAAGVMLYRAKDWAVQNLIDRTRINIILASVFSVIFFENAWLVAGSPVAKVSYTLAMWFFTAGILGLFAKRLNRSTPVRKFLGEASYWVYLWHPVIVIALAWAAGKVAMNLWLAIPLIIVMALAATLASYRWWVRDTLIGAWISGRRRSELGLPKLFGAKVGYDAGRAAGNEAGRAAGNEAGRAAD
jgi:glucan biosynthesis protein C